VERGRTHGHRSDVASRVPRVGGRQHVPAIAAAARPPVATLRSMLFAQLLYAASPSFAVAAVMLAVNHAVVRASTRRMFAGRTVAVPRPRARAISEGDAAQTSGEHLRPALA